ncbi:MAG: Crp/Fnr family transcriptional regulator [Beijerinckiaceae bacterium]|nr:Crp/Fnr family transcriptional regulator [Beijerinckiaceae bacterium]
MGLNNVMNSDEAKNFLSSEGWLSRTAPWFRDAVISKVQFKLMKPGEVLFLAGEEPRGLIGLAAGGVSASIAPDDAIPVVAHFFLPGSWFGEIPALTGRQHVVGLQTTRESALLLLPTPSLSKILAADPSGWRYLGLLAAEHTELSVGVISDLMRRDSKQRFIALLLRLAGCRMPSGQNSFVYEVDVSQEDLAVISNLARTTVNGILNELENARLTKRNYRRIQIVNQDKLRALIDGF